MRDELRALFKSLGVSAHEAISIKSPSYKQMGIDHTQLGESELIDLIVREPRLMRRPLVVVDGKPIFGFKAEKFSEVFKK